ncbi:D-alanyl-D-alanine carboxypeptidase/D-alanyl-D-alanine-endopeptidase [Leucothrix sargassi]|nr:D-alanyl-D-alanine carboxypeptidase/D-alanyl-D-alanine-endopeptidase [Leucothrix sargassi]
MRVISRTILLLLASVSAASAETVIKNTPSPAIAYQPVQEQTLSGLPESVLDILKKSKVPAENLSVYISDINAQQPMLSHNIDVLRAPASTIKLVTTYAALKQLGPNYSWTTEAWRRGEVVNGVLQGDLILKGYGDPFLVYERFWKFAHELRDFGLTGITGDIIIDNSYYNIPEHNSSAFDGQGFRVYNAGASPLMFNFQASRIRLAAPEEEGATKASVVHFPQSTSLKIDNQVRLVNGRCKRQHSRPNLGWKSDGSLTVKGTFARDCPPRFVMRLVSNPDEHVFNAFTQFWRELGNTFEGRLKTGRVTEGDELLHRYASPTLGEQIRLINKWSNNVMTRQLFLTVGATRMGAPATDQKGRDAVKAILEQQGVDTQGMIIDVGSGLSRKSRITARQMAQLLELAYRDAYMPEFLSSMSLPGLDGTLASRFKNEDLKGRSHLKTGTLNNVTALSGYMLNRQGRRLVVVIQHNGNRASSSAGAKVQDEILRWAFER